MRLRGGISTIKFRTWPISEVLGSQRLRSAIERSAEPFPYPISGAISSRFGQERNLVHQNQVCWHSVCLESEKIDQDANTSMLPNPSRSCQPKNTRPTTLWKRILVVVTPMITTGIVNAANTILMVPVSKMYSKPPLR